MKKNYFMIFGALLCMIGAASAEVYQYVDEEGVTHYTNDMTMVPVDKRSGVTEYPEIQTEPGTENQIHPHANSNVQIRAVEEEAQERRGLREKKLKEQKMELEREYEQLLIERSAIENDTSFQKRRTKTKYKNRPYIQELIKREQQINARLVEIEAKMKKIAR